MIELIGILACLLACIAVPIQAASIRSGAAFKKTPDKRDLILTSARKQFTMLGWVGLVFGVVEIGLMFIEQEPGEWIFKLIAAVLWLVLSGLCFVSLRSIANIPATAPVA